MTTEGRNNYLFSLLQPTSGQPAVIPDIIQTPKRPKKTVISLNLPVPTSATGTTPSLLVVFIPNGPRKVCLLFVLWPSQAILQWAFWKTINEDQDISQNYDSARLVSAFLGVSGGTVAPSDLTIQGSINATQVARMPTLAEIGTNNLLSYKRNDRDQLVTGDIRDGVYALGIPSGTGQFFTPGTDATADLGKGVLLNFPFSSSSGAGWAPVTIPIPVFTRGAYILNFSAAASITPEDGETGTLTTHMTVEAYMFDLETNTANWTPQVTRSVAFAQKPAFSTLSFSTCIIPTDDELGQAPPGRVRFAFQPLGFPNTATVNGSAQMLMLEHYDDGCTGPASLIQMEGLAADTSLLFSGAVNREVVPDATLSKELQTDTYVTGQGLPSDITAAMVLMSAGFRDSGRIAMLGPLSQYNQNVESGIIEAYCQRKAVAEASAAGLMDMLGGIAKGLINQIPVVGPIGAALLDGLFQAPQASIAMSAENRLSNGIQRSQVADATGAYRTADALGAYRQAYSADGAYRAGGSYRAGGRFKPMITDGRVAGDFQCKTCGKLVGDCGHLLAQIETPKVDFPASKRDSPLPIVAGASNALAIAARDDHKREGSNTPACSPTQGGPAQAMALPSNRDLDNFHADIYRKIVDAAETLKASQVIVPEPGVFDFSYRPQGRYVKIIGSDAAKKLASSRGMTLSGVESVVSLLGATPIQRPGGWTHITIPAASVPLAVQILGGQKIGQCSGMGIKVSAGRTAAQVLGLKLSRQRFEEQPTAGVSASAFVSPLDPDYVARLGAMNQGQLGSFVYGVARYPIVLTETSARGKTQTGHIGYVVVSDEPCISSKWVEYSCAGKTLSGQSFEITFNLNDDIKLDNDALSSLASALIAAGVDGQWVYIPPVDGLDAIGGVSLGCAVFAAATRLPMGPLITGGMFVNAPGWLVPIDLIDVKMAFAEEKKLPFVYNSEDGTDVQALCGSFSKPNFKVSTAAALVGAIQLAASFIFELKKGSDVGYKQAMGLSVAQASKEAQKRAVLANAPPKAASTGTSFTQFKFTKPGLKASPENQLSLYDTALELLGADETNRLSEMWSDPTQRGTVIGKVTAAYAIKYSTKKAKGEGPTPRPIAIYRKAQIVPKLAKLVKLTAEDENILSKIPAWIENHDKFFALPAREQSLQASRLEKLMAGGAILNGVMSKFYGSGPYATVEVARAIASETAGPKKSPLRKVMDESKRRPSPYSDAVSSSSAGQPETNEDDLRRALEDEGYEEGLDDVDDLFASD